MMQRGKIWWLIAWLCWSFAISVCPIALVVIGDRYAVPPATPPFVCSRPWAAELADKVMVAHVVITVLTALAVPWLVRDWHFRLAVWITLGFFLWVTAFIIYLGTCMAVTGWYF